SSPVTEPVIWPVACAESDPCEARRAAATRAGNHCLPNLSPSIQNLQGDWEENPPAAPVDSGAADGHDAGALCATGRGNTGLTNVWISSNAVSRRLPAVPNHQPSVEGVAYTSMWTPHGARVLDPGGEAGPTVWIRRTAAVRRP